MLLNGYPWVSFESFSRVKYGWHETRASKLVKKYSSYSWIWFFFVIVWRHTQKLGRHRMWFMNILQRLIFPPRTCRILPSAIWDETWTHTYLSWTLDMLTDHLCWKYQPSKKVEFWLKTVTKNGVQFSKPEKLMSNSIFSSKTNNCSKSGLSHTVSIPNIRFFIGYLQNLIFFDFWKKVHFLPTLWAITRRTFWVLQNGTNLRYQKTDFAAFWICLKGWFLI